MTLDARSRLSIVRLFLSIIVYLKSDRPLFLFSSISSRVYFPGESMIFSPSCLDNPEDFYGRYFFFVIFFLSLFLLLFFFFFNEFYTEM